MSSTDEEPTRWQCLITAAASSCMSSVLAMSSTCCRVSGWGSRRPPLTPAGESLRAVKSCTGCPGSLSERLKLEGEADYPDAMTNSLIFTLKINIKYLQGKQNVLLSSPLSAWRDGDLEQFFSLRSFLNRRLTKVFERCRLVLPTDDFSFCCLLLCLSSKDAVKRQQPSIFTTNKQKKLTGYLQFFTNRDMAVKGYFFSTATSSLWGNPQNSNSSGCFNLISQTSSIDCLFLFQSAPLFPAVNLPPWKEPR